MKGSLTATLPAADPLQAQRERLAALQSRIDAPNTTDTKNSSDTDPGPGVDRTIAPPEFYRTHRVGFTRWNPDDVSHVVEASHGRSITIVWRNGLAADDGRHYPPGSRLCVPGDISVATADKWIADGTARENASVTIVFYRWGSLTLDGRSYQNSYRLAVHLPEDRAQRFLSGDGLGGLKYACAIKISDGRFDGDLSTISLPAPRERFVDVVGYSLTAPERLFLRFQFRSGGRAYLTELDAVSATLAHRGRIIDEHLLSPMAAGKLLEGRRMGRVQAGDLSAVSDSWVATESTRRAVGGTW